MKKITLVSIVLTIMLISGTILFSRGENKTETTTITQNQNNDSSISIDGKQVIEIYAKGGYYPRSITAKANTPTVIKVKTQGTFDCSSALVIPSIGYRTNLPPTGETLIDIPLQEKGSILQGLCAMGMYSFSVEFN